ncbi:MAG: hypothetical protein ACI30I_00525 [Parabacteroides sp.]
MESVGKWSRAIGFVLIALLLHVTAGAQPLSAWIDWELNLANNHLWRGIEVSDGCVLTSSLSVSTPKEHLRLGIWSGTNTSGNYKELNYFAELRAGRWKLAFWDTYNFSPGATYNHTEFFNYKARTTGRFLDAILTYQVSPRFPLSLSWSTILSGRDRNALNTANKYSSFVYAEYPVWQSDVWRVEAGCGATFVLRPLGERATFYSERPGIIHVEMKVSHPVTVCRHTIPLHAKVVWNPVCDRAFFQMGAQLFSF